MTFKKLVLLFCILCAVIICSCGNTAEYTFNNKSTYTVIVTLSKPYKVENSSEAASMGSTLWVSSNEKKTVYIDGHDADFTWTTSNAGDNSKVQCSVNGSEAIFRDL